MLFLIIFTSTAMFLCVCVSYDYMCGLESEREGEIEVATHIYFVLKGDFQPLAWRVRILDVLRKCPAIPRFYTI